MTDLFKWRHYESEIILTCVRWYLRYALSDRDLEEMMTERGLSVDHSTIFRWVQRYAPELDERCRPHLKKTNDSWRVTEGSNFRNRKGNIRAQNQFIAELFGLTMSPQIVHFV